MENSSRNQVVIIEDNLITNNLLRDWLKLHFSVLCFLDAESATRLLTPSSERWVFVIDYNLPGENGLLLKSKLSPLFPSSKFILISGLFDEKLTNQAKEAGFDTCMSKPFRLPVLHKKISELLDISSTPNLLEKLKKTTPA